MKLILFLLVAGGRSGIAEASPPNWDGYYPPCDRHPELLNREHTDLGVRISTSNKTLARQFARAMEFWAEVLDMYETVFRHFLSFRRSRAENVVRSLPV